MSLKWKLIYLQSCVRTFMPSSEDHPQNVPLPVPTQKYQGLPAYCDIGYCDSSDCSEFKKNSTTEDIGYCDYLGTIHKV